MITVNWINTTKNIPKNSILMVVKWIKVLLMKKTIKQLFSIPNYWIYLYGLPSENAEFYLRMVQIDTDNDTVPDFTEKPIIEVF